MKHGVESGVKNNPVDVLREVIKDRTRNWRRRNGLSGRNRDGLSGIRKLF